MEALNRQLPAEEIYTYPAKNQIGFATSISDRIKPTETRDPNNPPESSRKWHYSKVDEEDRVPYTGIFPKRWAQGHCYILDRKNCEILASELCKDKYELSSSNPAKEWLYEDMAITSILFDKGVDLIEIGKIVEHLTIDHCDHHAAEAHLKTIREKD